MNQNNLEMTMVLKVDSNGIITDYFDGNFSHIMISTPPPYGILTFYGVSTFYGESLMSKMRRERSVKYDNFSQDIKWICGTEGISVEPIYKSPSSIEVVNVFDIVYGSSNTHTRKSASGILECRNGIIK